MKKNNLISILMTVVIASAAIIGVTYAITGMMSKNNSSENDITNPGSLNSGENNQQAQKPDTSLSPAKQNMVAEYIRENINELSPDKAVLGGTFMVESIDFEDPNNCTVAYEDGHIALSAEVNFDILPSNEIVINSFQVKNGTGPDNFKRTGNLTKPGNEWVLLYELPGQPALTAELNFTNRSVCYKERAVIPCEPSNWQIGDRAEVSGFFEESKLWVSDLIVLDSEKNANNAPQRAEEFPVNNFEECVAAGNEAMYPDCIDCPAYCETASGNRFEVDTAPQESEGFCEDLCGNGTCEEMVCMAEGCPCAETPSSCPEDCD